MQKIFPVKFQHLVGRANHTSYIINPSSLHLTWIYGVRCMNYDL